MKAARPIHLRPAPDAKSLEGLSDLHPVLARVFAMRGVVDVDELDYGLSLLAPVGALENIDAAVDLLLGHRDKRIVIVGDFDVDGATSTALLIRCMNEFGFAEIDYLVPGCHPRLSTWQRKAGRRCSSPWTTAFRVLPACNAQTSWAYRCS